MHRSFQRLIPFSKHITCYFWRQVLFIFLVSFPGISPANAITFEPVPPIDQPLDNPSSEAKYNLGKKLFFDTVLSGDNSMSCSSCHQPELGWTDGKRKALGFKQRELDRNTPTILNTGFYRYQFWDGRALSLEEQAKAPIQSPVEMNQNIDELISELSATKDYPGLFQQAFGSNKITLDRIAQAIAVFERSLVSSDSAYDRFWKGDKNALSAEARKGMKLFFGKAKCSICHSGPLFTDGQFHNIGIPFSGKKDPGRKKISGEKFHEGAFKTPSLRDTSLTGPYMHNGVFSSLKEVIEFYDLGGVVSPNKSPFISPIGLNAREKNNLLEFLKALTSDKFINSGNENYPE